MCVCLFLTPCHSLALRHTNIHLPACVTHVHTNKYPHTDARVCTQRHTHISSPHSHSSSAPTRGGVCLCVCVSVRTVPCACAYTGISLHRQTFPLLPAEAVCRLILPCKSGIPSSLPSAVQRPSRSLLGVPPELQIWHLSLRLSKWQMASAVVRILAASLGISPSMSTTPFCLLLTGLGVVGVFFGINCKRT